MFGWWSSFYSLAYLCPSWCCYFFFMVVTSGIDSKCSCFLQKHMELVRSANPGHLRPTKLASGCGNMPQCHGNELGCGLHRAEFMNLIWGLWQRMKRTRVRPWPLDIVIPKVRSNSKEIHHWREASDFDLISLHVVVWESRIWTYRYITCVISHVQKYIYILRLRCSLAPTTLRAKGDIPTSSLPRWSHWCPRSAKIPGPGCCLNRQSWFYLSNISRLLWGHMYMIYLQVKATKIWGM